MKKYMFTGVAALVSLLFAASLNAEIFELKNDKVQFQVDEKGNLVSLKNVVANREYAGGEGLWRIVYEDGLSKYTSRRR